MKKSTKFIVITSICLFCLCVVIFFIGNTNTVIQSPSRQLTEEIFDVALPESVIEISVSLKDYGDASSGDAMWVKIILKQEELKDFLQDKYILLQPYDLQSDLHLSANETIPADKIDQYCIAFTEVTNGKASVGLPYHYYICKPIGSHVTVYLTATNVGWNRVLTVKPQFEF